MKFFFVFLSFLFLSTSGFAGEAISLPQLTNPDTLKVGENQFYVSEGATVFIFSLKDYKIRAKFGKKGMGPQEFNLGAQRRLNLYVTRDSLVINSTNKVSFYTKDGIFIKELKTAGQSSFSYRPFGDDFIGIRSQIGQGDRPSLQFGLSIFDSNFKIKKNIALFDFGKKGNLYFPPLIPIYRINKKKILAFSGKNLELKIYNSDGDLVSTIFRDYEALRVSADYKKGIHDYIKRISPASYMAIKDMIKFDNYFPAIRNFYVAGNKIFILTYLMKEDKIECFIYNTDYKFDKKVFLPIYMKTPVAFYPFCIKQNKLYQLIENDDEFWELHITRID